MSNFFFTMQKFEQKFVEWLLCTFYVPELRLWMEIDFEDLSKEDF